MLARILMVALFTFSLAAGAAWGQDLEWIRQFGTNGNDVVWDVDADGDVYAAGHTTATLPGQTSSGNNDAFLRKYDSDGNLAWTRQFGTSSSDYAYGVFVDASGVYVAGDTGGALPGQVSSGSSDAFLRKYDFDGNIVWTRQFGGAFIDGASDAFADSTGVYVAGFNSNNDVFVRKYDAAGSFIWENTISSPSSDQALDISGDFVGSVYVAGRTTGALPGNTFVGGASDAFAAKLNAADGNVLWIRQIGTSGREEARGIVVDSSGIYVGGFTDGALAQPPGGIGLDSFIRKYDSSGSVLWTRQYRLEASSHIDDVDVDPDGFVYVTGINYSNYYVRKYSSSGDVVWTTSAVSSTICCSSTNGVAVDRTAVYFGGRTTYAYPGQTFSGGFEDALVTKHESGFIDPFQPLITNVTLPVNETINITYFSTDNAGNNETPHFQVHNLDACPTAAGPYQGCPVGDANLVEIQITDRASGGSCPGGGSTCTLPVEGASIKVFDRNKLNGLTITLRDGGTTTLGPNPSASLYDDIYEAPESNSQAKVSPFGCVTNSTGRCIAGENATGNYLVIVKYVDSSTKIVYTGKTKAPADFQDTNGDSVPDLASLNFLIMKLIRRDGTVQLSGAQQTVVVGSMLVVTYPDESIWDASLNLYTYPFIFTSDSTWTVDVCAQVPQGYEIIGVYDENDNLLTTSNCTQAFVAGEIKVILFDVLKTGSPPEWTFQATLKATAPSGKVTQVLLAVPTVVEAARVEALRNLLLAVLGVAGLGAALAYYLARSGRLNGLVGLTKGLRKAYFSHR
jgi:hypothetical protein